MAKYVLIRGVSQTPFNLPGQSVVFNAYVAILLLFLEQNLISSSTLESVEGVEVRNSVLQARTNFILTVGWDLSDAQVDSKLNEFLKFVYVITSFELLLASVEPGKLRKLLFAKPKVYRTGLGCGGDLAFDVSDAVHAFLFIPMNRKLRFAGARRLDRAKFHIFDGLCKEFHLSLKGAKGHLSSLILYQRWSQSALALLLCLADRLEELVRNIGRTFFSRWGLTQKLTIKNVWIYVYVVGKFFFFRLRSYHWVEQCFGVGALTLHWW